MRLTRNATIIAYACACGGRIDDIVHLTEIDLKWKFKPVLGVKAYYISSKTDKTNNGTWQLEYSYHDPLDKYDGVMALLRYIRCTLKKEVRTDANNRLYFQRI